MILPIKERLLRHVEQTETCWLWTGYIQKKAGYGLIAVSPRGKNALTHRVSWEVFVGPIPDGLCVLHKCDVRACVRPDHLFLGTDADNVADMWSKGRGLKPSRQPTYEERLRGSRHGIAKLTEQEVIDMRQQYALGDVSQQSLADYYGVSQAVVSAIVRRKWWQHI